MQAGKGLKVIPFKKGPDYIDAGWMSLAAGSPCYNLDLFLIPKERALESFTAHATGDMAIIEGNRGLHDGMDAEGSCSTAELAKLLSCPVILILDCTKMTRTAAAVVLGCMGLDREVALRGVVLNQIAGIRHEAVIRASLEKYCGIPVLGAIPRLKTDELPERHMGLTPYQEHPDTIKVIDTVRGIAEKYLDLDSIVSIAGEAGPLQSNSRQTAAPGYAAPGMRKTATVGVIRDSAFQFYYPENLEELEKRGAEIVDISALEAEELPPLDALYIGGGFPETNALRLAENEKFRHSVRSAVEAGLPLYAECGGLMFLGTAIIAEGKRYPMVGVFPLVFEMRRKPQAHGYTIVEVVRTNPFYPVGTVLHGHEFHYSAVTDLPQDITACTAFKMERGHGLKDKADGIWYKNAFATYTHIHVFGAYEWADGFMKKAVEFRKGRRVLPA
jgi:cobyrinic acid a,c-diamide synthase